MKRYSADRQHQIQPRILRDNIEEKRAGDEKCLEFVSACPGGELLPVRLEGAVVLPHPRILALEAPLPRPPAVLYHVTK